MASAPPSTTANEMHMVEAMDLLRTDAASHLVDLANLSHRVRQSGRPATTRDIMRFDELARSTFDKRPESRSTVMHLRKEFLEYHKDEDSDSDGDGPLLTKGGQMSASMQKKVAEHAESHNLQPGAAYVASPEVHVADLLKMAPKGAVQMCINTPDGGVQTYNLPADCSAEQRQAKAREMAFTAMKALIPPDALSSTSKTADALGELQGQLAQEAAQLSAAELKSVHPKKLDMLMSYLRQHPSKLFVAQAGFGRHELSLEHFEAGLKDELVEELIGWDAANVELMQQRLFSMRFGYYSLGGARIEEGVVDQQLSWLGLSGSVGCKLTSQVVRILWVTREEKKRVMDRLQMGNWAEPEPRLPGDPASEDSLETRLADLGTEWVPGLGGLMPMANYLTLGPERDAELGLGAPWFTAAMATHAGRMRGSAADDTSAAVTPLLLTLTERDDPTDCRVLYAELARIMSAVTPVHSVTREQAERGAGVGMLVMREHTFAVPTLEEASLWRRVVSSLGMGPFTFGQLCVALGAKNWLIALMADAAARRGHTVTDAEQLDPVFHGVVEAVVGCAQWSMIEDLCALDEVVIRTMGDSMLYGFWRPQIDLLPHTRAVTMRLLNRIAEMFVMVHAEGAGAPAATHYSAVLLEVWNQGLATVIRFMKGHYPGATGPDGHGVDGHVLCDIYSSCIAGRNNCVVDPASFYPLTCLFFEGAGSVFAFFPRKLMENAMQEVGSSLHQFVYGMLISALTGAGPYAGPGDEPNRRRAGHPLLIKALLTSLILPDGVTHNVDGQAILTGDSLGLRDQLTWFQLLIDPGLVKQKLRWYIKCTGDDYVRGRSVHTQLAPDEQFQDQLTALLSCWETIERTGRREINEAMSVLTAARDLKAAELLNEVAGEAQRLKEEERAQRREKQEKLQQLAKKRADEAAAAEAAAAEAAELQKRGEREARFANWKDRLAAFGKNSDQNMRDYAAAGGGQKQQLAKKRLLMLPDEFNGLADDVQFELREHFGGAVVELLALHDAHKQHIKDVDLARKSAKKSSPPPSGPASPVDEAPPPGPAAAPRAPPEPAAGKKKKNKGKMKAPPPQPADAGVVAADLGTLADVPGLAAPAVPESTIGGDTTCVVCFENKKEWACIPCGHMCVCEGCSKKLKQCPACRGPAATWVKIHVV